MLRWTNAFTNITKASNIKVSLISKVYEKTTLIWVMMWEGLGLCWEEKEGLDVQEKRKQTRRKDGKMRGMARKVNIFCMRRYEYSRENLSK